MFYLLAGVGNNAIYWGAGAVFIAVMGITAFDMMMASTRDSVNIWEMVSLRFGMSIYAGWLVAAETIQIDILLQYLGFKDTGNGILKPLMLLGEDN